MIILDHFIMLVHSLVPDPYPFSIACSIDSFYTILPIVTHGIEFCGPSSRFYVLQVTGSLGWGLGMRLSQSLWIVSGQVVKLDIHRWTL